MRNIKLILEYDGSGFLGFQRQARGRTVQQELEEALKKLFQRKITVTGSSRTDSGVHAEAQIVNFHVHSRLPVEKIKLGINHYLPEDVSVLAAEEVKHSFHAQRSAKWKCYQYLIWNARVRSPLRRRNFYFYPHTLDVSLMRQSTKVFLGRHDFRAFESSGSRRKSALRNIRKLSIQKTGDEICFTIEANGFLYKMVRSIIGALIAAGSGKLDQAGLKKVLEGKIRMHSISVVPGNGLILKKIIF